MERERKIDNQYDDKCIVAKARDGQAGPFFQNVTEGGGATRVGNPTKMLLSSFSYETVEKRVQEC